MKSIKELPFNAKRFVKNVDKYLLLMSKLSQEEKTAKVKTLCKRLKQEETRLYGQMLTFYKNGERV